MKTIWKYEINVEQDKPFTVTMPAGSKIIELNKQGLRKEDRCYIWCLVDTDNTTEDRRFVLIGTGEEITYPYARYVGTVQFWNGSFTLHMLEI